MCWCYYSVPEVDDDEDDLEERVEALNVWFEANGGSGARARVNGDRCGLYSTTQLKKGDTYLHIPKHLLITGEGEALEATFDNAPIEIARAVQMCHALLLRDDPYTRSLPRSFANHPLHYEGLTDKTYIADALRECQQSFKEFLVACRWCRDRRLPAFTRKQYAWAYFCWMTRCIRVDDGDWCFVPMVDMTNCRWSPHVECSRTLLSEDKSEAVMTTHKDLEENEEIFENYGWGNFDYLLAHGFILPPFPHDVLVLRPRRYGPGNIAWQPRLSRDMNFHRTQPDSWEEYRSDSLKIAVEEKNGNVPDAWNYLASLCDEVLEENGKDPRLLAFYQSQKKLARDLQKEFKQNAIDALHPPPYISDEETLKS